MCRGGVETHCQNLYPEIYRRGSAEVCVIARSPYVNYRRSEYQGVKLKSLWAPKSRKFEAIIHSALAAFSTLFDGSNVVHVHAVGPGPVVPLLRLLGKTRRLYPSWPGLRSAEMGPDGQRDAAPWRKKWAVKYANEVIVISEVINNLIKHKHGRHNAHVIYNGVRRADLPPADRQAEILDKYGLKTGPVYRCRGPFLSKRKDCTISLPPMPPPGVRYRWCSLAMPTTPMNIANA